MRIPFFHVDAFASEVFKGNPAGVCLLREWPPDARMQAIAAENNLPETAFVLRGKDRIELRWFTPTVEVDLCGHATLATAHVIFSHLAYSSPEVRFETRSGRLTVKRDGDLFAMDFPAAKAKPIPEPEGLARALGGKPIVYAKTSHVMALFGSAAEVAALDPDFPALKRLLEAIDGHPGLLATAVGDEGTGFDFVSRFFAPAHGIDEDPVTGSAHCTSVPYWAKKLGKIDLVARQISKRGGTLWCTDAGERVIIRGRCVDYMMGEIAV